MAGYSSASLAKWCARNGCITKDTPPPFNLPSTTFGYTPLEWLREFIRERPDATLQECAAHLGTACSLATISRALTKLGLPRKKKVPRAAEQDSPVVQEKRREFCEELAGI